MKSVIFVLLIVLNGVAVKGQFIKAIGVKAGLSEAKQTREFKSINTKMDGNYLPGLFLVASTDFINSKYFTLSTDFGYLRKGNILRAEITTTDLPDATTGGYMEYKTSIGYLTINPQIKFRYQSGNWAPYVFCGPRVDFQISYSSDLETSTPTNSRKTLVGLSTGVGIQLQKNKTIISIEAQQLKDFTATIDTPTTDTNTGLKVTNHGFVIAAGLKFSLNKTETIPSQQ